jgi:Zn-dependent M28 family amino/carboxypeptidase
MGQRDGLALRDLVALSDEPTRVKVKLDVQRVPNLKSGTVWATLPGMTDENIIVVAHRDGWFEAANDNAAGVATALGIAEYFSKIPKEQRRRTITFLGTTGHHDNGAESGTWLAQHPEVFAKTAVLLNAEHTGAAQTGQNAVRMSNGGAAATWFAGGDALAGLVAQALDSFGVVTYPQSAASPAGEIGRYFHLAPSVQVMTGGFVWHSNEETAASLSPGVLTAITRTYAKVMADSNALTLQELRKSVAGSTR